MSNLNNPDLSQPIPINKLLNLREYLYILEHLGFYTHLDDDAFLYSLSEQGYITSSINKEKTADFFAVAVCLGKLPLLEQIMNSDDETLLPHKQAVFSNIDSLFGVFLPLLVLKCSPTHLNDLFSFYKQTIHFLSENSVQTNARVHEHFGEFLLTTYPTVESKIQLWETITSYLLIFSSLKPAHLFENDIATSSDFYHSYHTTHYFCTILARAIYFYSYHHAEAVNSFDFFSQILNKLDEDTFIHFFDIFLVNITKRPMKGDKPSLSIVFLHPYACSVVFKNNISHLLEYCDIPKAMKKSPEYFA